ncbi:hypothetical protein ACQW5G_04185 [Fructilactobacillus sp. Tb1]|uniref:hypothetical protein n=1 Tax=Fructilactobacillus sp. Tb1 TaxID=3422304 RepID=UPI003D299401
MKTTASKDAIANAFFKQTCERHISEITISGLVESSGISRQTFYNNFTNLYDVIIYLENILDEKLNLPNASNFSEISLSIQDIYKYLPDNIYKNRKILHKIYTTDLRGFWLVHILEKYKEVIQNTIFNNFESPTLTKNDAATIFIHTIIAAIDDWVSKPIPENPETFSNTLKAILETPVINFFEIGEND